jgi:glycerol-3-phosphate dehydrogenase
LGVAKAAVSKGLTVALFERGKLAQQTSANSHQIIHSGIRYLQSGSFLSALDSARSLAFLRDKYPQFVSSLACWMSLEGESLFRSFLLSMGYRSYRGTLLLGGVRAEKWPGLISAQHSANYQSVCDHPLLRDVSSKGFFGWVDGWIKDHQGLVRELSEEILRDGGVVFEDHSVLGVERSKDRFIVSTNREQLFSSRFVADCRGFSGSPALCDSAPYANSKFCIGFNLGLAFDISEGVGIAVNSGAGRLFFVAPRSGSGGVKSAIGTGYVAVEEDTFPRVADGYNIGTDQLKGYIKESDIAPMLDAVARRLKRKISSSDVVNIECGVLPIFTNTSLIRDKFRFLGRERFFQRSFQGESSITADPSTEIFSSKGYFVVRSGKYTTFPIVGERVLGQILKFS